MFCEASISVLISFSRDRSMNYVLYLDPFLIAAIAILSIIALVRSMAIRKYGRRGVESVSWARLAAWIGIACGYLLLIARFLLG